MGSTCFDLGAQIARAAAAGVAERETEMDSFGLLTAQMLSTHGNQQEWDMLRVLCPCSSKM